MEINEFQNLIKEIYFEKDSKRGADKTFIWLIEEVGELAEQLNKGKSKEELEEEFADVLAWIFSLANLENIDLEKAITKKYPGKCIKCGKIPCLCASTLISINQKEGIS